MTGIPGKSSRQFRQGINNRLAAGFRQRNDHNFRRSLRVLLFQFSISSAVRPLRRLAPRRRASGHRRSQAPPPGRARPPRFVLGYDAPGDPFSACMIKNFARQSSAEWPQSTRPPPPDQTATRPEESRRRTLESMKQRTTARTNGCGFRVRSTRALRKPRRDRTM
jgi:hypothetical protein